MNSVYPCKITHFIPNQPHSALFFLFFYISKPHVRVYLISNLPDFLKKLQAFRAIVADY